VHTPALAVALITLLTGVRLQQLASAAVVAIIAINQAETAIAKA